jgi:hypothetical protein
MFRRLFAFLLVFALAAGEIPARAAGVSALGVVTQASGANLASASVSAGAAVFDGDFFTTSPNGLLRVRAGAAQLYLAGQSAVKLNASPGGTIAQLTGGTLVFSSARAAAMDIEFAQAHIRPTSDQPTIAQISTVGARMLSISARSGSLEFSYKGETETIPEGASYKILLDPTDEEASSISASGTATPAFPDQGGPKRPKKRRKAFIIFWSAVAAAIFIPVVIKTLESPEKP